MLIAVSLLFGGFLGFCGGLHPEMLLKIILYHWLFLKLRNNIQTFVFVVAWQNEINFVIKD